MGVPLLAWLRPLWVRVGSDPYYASFDKAMHNIKDELDRLRAARAARRRLWAHLRARFLAGFAAVYACVLAYAAWVARQPEGRYGTAARTARLAPVFLAPALAWAAAAAGGALRGLLDRRSTARTAQLEAKLRQQVGELKDSTRYQRTLELLQKYDPDYAPPEALLAAAAAAGGKRGGSGGAGGLPVGRVAGAAVTAASATLQGAGSRVVPVLAQLWAHAANSLVADDPVVVNLLREAQQQAVLGQQQLEAARRYCCGLLRDNIRLKRSLGEPTEEEEAALAATEGAAAAAAAPLPAAAVVAAAEGDQPAALPPAAGAATAAAEEGEGEEEEERGQSQGEEAEVAVQSVGADADAGDSGGRP